jgi:RNA polymerase sigma-70 factor (ECF subfamily)
MLQTRFTDGLPAPRIVNNGQASCGTPASASEEGGFADMFVASVYEADRASLEGFVRAITRDHEAAEEICQEAFTRLLLEVRAGRAPDNPRAWLRRVASNLAISRGRHSQVVDRKRASLVSYDIGDSAEVAALRHEDARAMVEALGRLQATDREALLLAASGLSGAEIGLRLGRSDGAVRTLLCRARHKLRLAIEPASALA